MRGLAWLVLATVMLSFAPAARAAVLTSCTTGCTTDSFGEIPFGVDYTVPTDGHEYRWDLWSDASHPTAIITLEAPNEVFDVANISNGNGTTSSHPFYSTPDFTWNEVMTPGHTAITVWAAPDFNFCPSNPAAGTVCAISNSVWGNAAFLTVNVDAPVTITFASTAIPEPAAWSLLIGGFFILGWALRRRRASLQAA